MDASAQRDQATVQTPAEASTHRCRWAISCAISVPGAIANSPAQAAKWKPAAVTAITVPRHEPRRGGYETGRIRCQRPMGSISQVAKCRCVGRIVAVFRTKASPLPRFLVSGRGGPRTPLVDKQQAEEALSIIRDVIANTREDLVAHNWGAIWLVHAFTNAAAFASIGWFVERRQLPLVWYLVPMAIVAAVNLLFIAAWWSGTAACGAMSSGMPCGRSVPSPFELDLYRGSAFVSLTASRLKDFGVGRIPDALRMNFYQATYRAHVTFTDFRGRRLRGCYFVRSETNSPLMNLTANLLPEFKAHRCSTSSILIARQGDRLLLTVDSQDDAAGKVVLVLDDSHALEAMPNTSVFPSIQEAYDFIVDFYEAFSYDPDSGDVLILQIDRGDWNIRVLDPIDHYLGFFVDGPFPHGKTQLDSVFYFRNTPYRWLPLVKERIKHRR